MSDLKVARRLRSQDLLEQLGYLFIYPGLLGFIRSDNGSEFIAKAVRYWLERLGVQTLFIQPVLRRVDTMSRSMES
jgi:putative transposase